MDLGSLIVYYLFYYQLGGASGKEHIYNDEHFDTSIMGHSEMIQLNKRAIIRNNTY